jgi:hypothetical protein
MMEGPLFMEWFIIEPLSIIGSLPDHAITRLGCFVPSIQPFNPEVQGVE